MEDLGAVVITGHNVSLAKTTSRVSICKLLQSKLFCDKQSYADLTFTATSYIAFPKHLVHLSQLGNFPRSTIFDTKSNTAQSFIYLMPSMGSVVLSQIQSPPNFVGSFVAGTGVRSAGDLSPCIVLGKLRTDFGGLSAMYLVPSSGSILNSVELVNAMALEYTNPDSFIAGGMQLSDGAGMYAYVIRANGLFESISYCTRYRRIAASDSTRRALASGVVVSSSVARGIVHVDGSLYTIVDTSVGDALSVSVLRAVANTGLVTKQVNIIARNGSFSCSEMTVTGMYVNMLCTQTHATGSANQSSVVISFDKELSLKKLPPGLVRDDTEVFAAENVPFARTSFAVTSTRATTSVSQSGATQPPSVAPTRSPSRQPSSVPTAQPSSSPTASPSISPQPTSSPSTGGPTNTYKPTVKPTQRPSRVPSRSPTISPSRRPTASPSVLPSEVPTLTPSEEPSLNPTMQPTRAPTFRPTRTASVPPSINPSAVPSALDTVEVSALGEKNNSSLGLVIGGSAAGFLCMCWLVYTGRKYSKVVMKENARTKRKKEFLAQEEELWLSMLKKKREILQEAERNAIIRRKMKNDEQQKMFALASVMESSGEESSATGSSYDSSDDYSVSTLRSSDFSDSSGSFPSSSASGSEPRTFSSASSTNSGESSSDHSSDFNNSAFASTPASSVAGPRTFSLPTQSETKESASSHYGSDLSDSEQEAPAIPVRANKAHLASSASSCSISSLHSSELSARAKLPPQAEAKLQQNPQSDSEPSEESDSSVSGVETSSSENSHKSQESGTDDESEEEGEETEGEEDKTEEREEESLLDAMEAGRLAKK